VGAAHGFLLVHFVESLRFIAVHIAVPIAHKVLLAEERSIGTEESESLRGSGGMGTNPEGLTATLHICVVTYRGIK